MTQALPIQSICISSGRREFAEHFRDKGDYSSVQFQHSAQKDHISHDIQKSKESLPAKAARRTLLVFVVAAFFLVTGALIGNSAVKASVLTDAGSFGETKCYTSICVDTNTTLWDIAGEYMGEGYSTKAAYINEVKKINHLTDDTIYSGQHLSIPYYEQTEIE